MRNSKPILLIEDDRLNAMTVRRALEELGAENPLINAADGEQALEHLRNQDNEPPCLVIVNVDTPKTNGMGFLQTVKTEELLENVPIVAISDSDRQRCIDEILRLGVVKYIAMPGDYAKLVEALGKVEHLWSSTELHAVAQASGPPRPQIPY